MLAGTVLYVTPRVAHCQYIASAEAGREVGAADLLFEHLLTEVFADKPYFDLGSSMQPGNSELNPGLVEQKEGFGARTVVQETLELRLA